MYTYAFLKEVMVYFEDTLIFFRHLPIPIQTSIFFCNTSLTRSNVSARGNSFSHLAVQQADKSLGLQALPRTFRAFRATKTPLPNWDSKIDWKAFCFVSLKGEGGGRGRGSVRVQYLVKSF